MTRHLTLGILVFAVACTGTSDQETDRDTDATDTVDDPGPIEIAGDYAQLFGEFPDQAVFAYLSVTNTTWVDDFSAYTIVTYDNEAQVAIAQNSGDNYYFPGLYSRFDWAVTDDGSLWYCQTAYDAASEADAAAVAAPDSSDPASTGCGSFPWTLLAPKLPIGGTWDDGYFQHTIDEAAWTMGDGVFHVAETSVDARFLIAQNDAGNEFFPGLWSRFDWHFDDTDLYYCQSAYDAADQAAAAESESDPSQLDSGCGGFAWSSLTPIDTN